LDEGLVAALRDPETKRKLSSVRKYFQKNTYFAQLLLPLALFAIHNSALLSPPADFLPRCRSSAASASAKKFPECSKGQVQQQAAVF
jgi:hypothetical protein